MVGGAAALKTYFDLERDANPHGTLVVTAGDAFGATPPLSAFFDDVPAVLAANLMGIDVVTLGNHNFDRGVGHLRAMLAATYGKRACAISARRWPTPRAKLCLPSVRTSAPLRSAHSPAGT